MRRRTRGGLDSDRRGRTRMDGGAWTLHDRTARAASARAGSHPLARTRDSETPYPPAHCLHRVQGAIRIGRPCCAPDAPGHPDPAPGQPPTHEECAGQLI